MSPKLTLTSRDQQTAHASCRARSALDRGEARRLALAYAPGGIDVCIWRKPGEELVAQIDGLPQEARELEPRVLPKSAPAPRFEVVHAPRRRSEHFPDIGLTRLEAMLRQAGIPIAVEDGRFAGVVLR